VGGSAPRTLCGLLRIMMMLDFLMVAYGVGFFAVAIFYVLACEKM
jgi:hypothetical protein